MRPLRRHQRRTDSRRSAVLAKATWPTGPDCHARRSSKDCVRCACSAGSRPMAGRSRSSTTLPYAIGPLNRPTTRTGPRDPCRPTRLLSHPFAFQRPTVIVDVRLRSGPIQTHCRAGGLRPPCANGRLKFTTASRKAFGGTSGVSTTTVMFAPTLAKHLLTASARRYVCASLRQRGRQLPAKPTTARASTISA